MATATVDLVLEIAELRERLERLEDKVDAQGANAPARVPARFAWEERVPAYLRRTSMEPLRAIAEESLRAMGLELRPPDETAAELRARIESGGVKPEERLGNTILEEMRGYR